MADQDQSHTSKPGMDRKPQRGKVDQPIVGSDVPDESKERHTEIAVEAGRKGGERHDDNR